MSDPRLDADHRPRTRIRIGPAAVWVTIAAALLAAVVLVGM